MALVGEPKRAQQGEGKGGEQPEGSKYKLFYHVLEGEL